jgi:hypothetical protein
MLGQRRYDTMYFQSWDWLIVSFTPRSLLFPSTKCTERKVEPEGFWRWCLTLRTTGYMGFVHRLKLQILENKMFPNLHLFPSSSERREISTLLGPLERVNQAHWLRLALPKGPNIVGVSLPLPEDGNRPSFRNVCFLIIYNSGRRTKSRSPILRKNVDHETKQDVWTAVKIYIHTGDRTSSKSL